LKLTVHRILSDLFEKWAKEPANHIEQLPPSGSGRTYYRISGSSGTVIGTYNPDKKENEAFLSFSEHFANLKLNVPKIYKVDKENDIYLQQDLGDKTLFSILNASVPNDYLLSIYRKVIDKLVEFQITAGRHIDYRKCYPRAAFDKQSMMWDLNYFKYYYLKLTNTPYDEQKLEDDFHTLSAFLLRTDCSYFLYRDMQSRNIMIVNDTPYFIDYQGGRKGALHYDIASLLFDAKANLSHSLREELLNYYISTVRKLLSIHKEEFLQFYYGYVLIRILQAMGAYGFRGLYEKKTHFLQSIPYAVRNLEWLLRSQLIPSDIPELTNALKYIIDRENNSNSDRLTHHLKVEINSFSYRRGIPNDSSGNGGGFVFDCRALQNPGKYIEYKNYNGTDKNVMDFLNAHKDTDEFLQHLFAIIDKSIEKYIERDFHNLMISFGCTGGKHRSVYCAESLAKHILEKYNITVILNHCEKEYW